MNVGIVMLIVGILINAFSDRAFRKGKITDMKKLLKIKLISLAIAVPGLIIAIVNN